MCRSSVLGSTAAHPAPSRHLQTGGRGGASTTGVLTSFQKSSRSPTTRNAAPPPASGRLGSAAELPRSFITLVRWPSPRSSRRLFFLSQRRGVQFLHRRLKFVSKKRLALCHQPNGSIYSNAEGHATIAGSSPKRSAQSVSSAQSHTPNHNPRDGSGAVVAALIKTTATLHCCRVSCVYAPDAPSRGSAEGQGRAF